MKAKEILKSIALTIEDPQNPYARRNDCHAYTARYLAAYPNISGFILLYGHSSIQVWHSIIIDDRRNVISDKDRDDRVFFDRNTLSVTYEFGLDKPVIYNKPVYSISIYNFRNQYLGNRH